MKEYEVIPGNNGKEIIIYYDNGVEETRELYSQPGFVAEIRAGYKLKTNLETFAGLKAYLISKVDEETEAGIFSGFSWDGLTFSMSINAQINWSNLLNIPDAMFPMELNSKNDVATYSLSLAGRQNFYLTALGHKNYHLQIGNQKKNEINACETLAELQTLKTSWGF